MPSSPKHDNEVVVDDPASVVSLAKSVLGINDDHLTDKQIAQVCRWVGDRAPEDKTIDVNGYKFSREGVEAMLFLAIMEFPEFYERMGLSQLN